MANPNAKYVGITGTNGKSTTTALIGHILQTAGFDVQVGGNIGVPVLDLKRLDENGVYVLETSSFQLDLINDIRFDIGVLLNITPDHLDRHGSMENYVSAKLRLFEHLHDISNAIISIDYEETKELIAGINISTKEEADIWVSEGELFIQDKAFDLNGLNLF